MDMSVTITTYEGGMAMATNTMGYKGLPTMAMVVAMTRYKEGENLATARYEEGTVMAITIDMAMATIIVKNKGETTMTMGWPMTL